MQIHSVQLSDYSNYKIGTTAKYFEIIQSLEDLQKASLFAKENQIKLFVLGSGTNILFSKSNYDEYLILKNEIKFTNYLTETQIEVGSGESMSELAISTCKHGLCGLEWAGGLPGTFGGAIRGNAGAFKGELKDNVISVKSYNPTLFKVIERTPDECQFGYRNSIFKNKAKNEIIISAIIELKNCNQSELLKSVQDKIEYRKTNHPMDYPSLGSTFKNVRVELFSPEIYELVKDKVKTDPFPVVPVAYLIDQSGLKGYQLGGMQVSTKQPNFIVNLDKGTSQEVLSIIEYVKRTVKDKFKVNLETEIQIF